MFEPQIGLFELFVVVRLNGAQPLFAFNTNAANGVGFTQMLRMEESIPQF
ncbi:hypothetical protein GCM10023229_23380 [Flavisolibacter ginsenosidimutans]